MGRYTVESLEERFQWMRERQMLKREIAAREKPPAGPLTQAEHR
jgi:hypothetical protein